jgi:SAM-dependent methyltransferase
VDLNGYLLSEARALAEAEGVGGRIEFREGSALSLPFPDGSFDVTLSVTMLEELDADSALAELVRVTRPGGRVVVAVRAVDLPLVVNMTTDERIRAQVEAPGFGTVSPTGCADASLYQRMRAAGLTGGRFFPAYSTSSKPDVLPASGLPARLGPPDREVYLSAVHKAIEAGTFYASQQLHCAWG